MARQATSRLSAHPQLRSPPPDIAQENLLAHVLVAEDDPAVRDLVTLNLIAEGHVVTEAADGHEALEHMRRGGLDVVVLDVMLPGIDGHRILAERLRLALVPTARLLMLTARADENSHLRAFELGCDEYLTKPFAPDALVAAVERLLRASHNDLARHRRRELRKADALDQLEHLLHYPRQRER